MLLDVDSFDLDNDDSYTELDKIDHLPFSSIKSSYPIILDTCPDSIETRCQFLFYVQPVPKYIQYCSYLI